MLSFQSIPSTTDSTSITRACSSVGGATVFLMLLLVAAKARLAARFAEPFLPFGVPDRRCGKVSPLLVEYLWLKNAPPVFQINGECFRQEMSALVWSLRDSTGRCSLHRWARKLRSLYAISAVTASKQRSVLRLTPSRSLSLVYSERVHPQNRTISKPFPRSLPQHERRTFLPRSA